jgi:cell division control protein 45
MSPEHVKRLHEKLEQHAPSHGLDDLKFWSFSFSHGFKTRLVASDVVHGVTALLEGVPEGAQSEVGGAGAFWRAVKALGMSQYDEMQVGLRHAMRSQRALMRQGGLALANKAVIRTVGSLARLALFLQDALRGTKKIERPLVVVGPTSTTNGVANDDDGSGTTNAQSSNDASFALVVGVTGAPRADDADGGNHFSQSFRRAAETARARFKHDAFEASVVQVARQNLGEFMEALSDIDAERVARERMHAAA